MPIKEVIETGKTVDTAIDSACEKLGCSRDECEWEIIDLPKKGFLGLKNIPAKVRVSIEIPDEVKPAARTAPIKAPASPAPVAPATPVAPVTHGAAQVSAAKPRQDSVTQEKPASAPLQTRKENEARHSSSASVYSEEKAGLATEYLSEILSKMGLYAELTVTGEDGGICINIDGKGLGAIIGRRGETLDAIQYLTSLVANRSDKDYTRITIDCGDYRMKRKETLEALARKLAAQVKRTNSSRTLEPMNPFERRIIHATVSEIEGVTSTSTGEEPNRRVVITTPAAKARGGRGGYTRNVKPQSDADDSRGSREPRENDREKSPRGYENRPPRGRGGRDSRDGARREAPRQAAAPSNEPPKKTPEAESTDKPLYAKIDLD